MAIRPVCRDTRVRIEGLYLPAHVGQYALERNAPQTIRIDIECRLSKPAVAGDKLGNSVDYVPIVKAVRALALRKKRRLIETLAREIAEACFAHPRVGEVRVAIRKPRKIKNPRCDAVGIESVFTRGECK